MPMATFVSRFKHWSVCFSNNKSFFPLVICLNIQLLITALFFLTFALHTFSVITVCVCLSWWMLTLPHRGLLTSLSSQLRKPLVHNVVFCAVSDFACGSVFAWCSQSEVKGSVYLPLSFQLPVLQSPIEGDPSVFILCDSSTAILIAMIPDWWV